MTVSFADSYGIDPSKFASTGALDPILSIDTQLFIDPALLRVSTIPELKGSYESVVSHFESVLKVIALIAEPGDRFWREADRLLTFPEVAGIAIGYSSSGTSGSGMGPGLRARLMETAQAIVRAGTSDATIFELVGLFEDNIGPDRISDMIAKIIASDLIKFTQRVCSDCGIKMEPHRLKSLGVEEDLPTNLQTGKHLILVPRQVLRDLPVAASFGDIDWISGHNEKLRGELNLVIGTAWRKLTVAEQKTKLKQSFIHYPDVLQKVIEAYLRSEPEGYDFESDRAGEVVWYRASKEAASSSPLELKLSETPSIDEVEAVVLKICERFQWLIEEGQLCRLLYDSDGSRKHESAAQLVFYGVASAYCEANNLDLSPEADAGRGPVDFKVSRGFNGKVLVEIKLSSNQQLVKGFQSQLPIYQAAERAQRGVYLVIDNGGPVARVERLKRAVIDAGDSSLRLVLVDGVVRPSASKASH